MQKTVAIERRSVADLSVEEFFKEYAKKGKPVIISDLDLFEVQPTFPRSVSLFQRREVVNIVCVSFPRRSGTLSS